MLKNWFKSYLRTARKNILTYFLNIVGLSIGLSCFIIIYSHVVYEFGYDRNHKNRHEIYRINTSLPKYNWKLPNTPYPLSGHLSSIPEIEEVCVLSNISDARIIIGEDEFKVENFRGISGSGFNIFDFNFISGSPDAPFPEPNSIIIGRRIADRYFPSSANLIGEVINIILKDSTYHLTVSGIIEDFGEQSSIKISCLVDIEFQLMLLEKEKWAKNLRTAWNTNLFETYILKSPGSDIDIIDKKINQLPVAGSDQQEITFFSQPLLKIHLYSASLLTGYTKGISGLKFLILTGLSILIISILNYLLLSIGQSGFRTSEVILRKIHGAQRNSLFKQFIFESVVQCTAAFLLACFLIFLLKNKLIINYGQDFNFELVNNPLELLVLVLVILSVGFLTGACYSVFLSGIEASTVREKLLFKTKTTALFPGLLITLQIFIFSSLLGGYQFVERQIQLGFTADRGFNNENLIVFSLSRDSEIYDYSKFMEEILSHPSVLNITGGANIPPSGSSFKTAFNIQENNSEAISIAGYCVDYNFFELLNIPFLRGRNFDLNLGTDQEKSVITESAARAFNIDLSSDSDDLPDNIIGIVRDLSFQSIRNPYVPLHFVLSDTRQNKCFIIKFRKDEFIRARNHIQNIIASKSMKFRVEPLPYDDILEKQYREEIKTREILRIFGVIALVIAVMGLFGHSLFLVQKQLKQLGIRKVFGAETKDLLSFFLKKFFWPLLAGNIMSAILVYYLVSGWLNSFAEKISLDPLVFLYTFLLSVIVVLFSVAMNFRYLVHLNPVKLLEIE